MNYKIFSLFALLCSFLSCNAQVRHIRVVDASSREGVEYACVLMTFADSTHISALADSTGEVAFNTSKKPIRVDASAVGYKPASKSLTELKDSSCTIMLKPKTIELSNVVVRGQRKLTKLTNEGLTYNMKADEKAKGENLLTALDRVPFVESKPDGTVSVRGTSNYQIYLNGRPYEMANVSAKSVLSSVKATDIDHVDVITNAAEKYGVRPGTVILNIVTRGKTIDGLTVSSFLGGTTQPYSNDGLTVLVKKGNVDFSLDYNYVINGQHHQPFTQDYSFRNPGDSLSRQIHVEGKGNGNVQSHTLRSMLKWRIDSINSLYADIHGNIETFNTSTNTMESSVEDDMTSRYKRSDSNSSGTVESNIIWRNYYKANPDREHFMLGYRYAYNPDKRHYFSTNQTPGGQDARTVQRTDGGVNEHSLTSSILIALARHHMLRLEAKGIIRLGRTSSVYSQDNSKDAEDKMHYNQNIEQLSAYYSGGAKKLYWGAGFSLEQSRMKMTLPENHELDYTRNNTNVLPYAYLYWTPNNSSQFSFSYSKSLMRPTVNMLNPFRSNTNNFMGTVGNPLLKPQGTQMVSMELYQTFNKGLVSVSPVYQYCNNMILSYRKREGDMMMNTYGNLGHSKDLSCSIYCQWKPLNWFRFSVSAMTGIRRVKADSPVLNQRDWYQTCAPSISFYLPHNWDIKTSYGFFKNLPDPWSTCSTLQQYSLSVVKSFLKGRLTASLEVKTPFQRYYHSKATTTLPSGDFVRQTNFITARSFGINIFYSLSKGRKVNIQRDKTLRDSDQQTGVQ